MLGYFQLQLILYPPKPNPDAVNVVNEQGAEAGEKVPADDEDPVQTLGGATLQEPVEEVDVAEGQIANQKFVIGSQDASSPYQMAVYLNNRGAAIERIELNDSRYQDLEDRSGWLGSLSLSDHPAGGCVIGTVAPGTPAANAKEMGDDQSVGLSPATADQEGDRIVKFNDQDVADADSFHAFLSQTSPDEEVELTVKRPSNGELLELRFLAKLVKRPLAIIAPEAQEFDSAGEDIGPTELRDQLSFLLTLGKLNDAKVAIGKNEIARIPSLWNANWTAKSLPAENGLGEGIEFAHRLSTEELAAIKAEGPLTFVKRYRLTTVDRASGGKQADHAPGYGIQFELEIRNEGQKDQKLAYQLDGPTGLPKEGWWYSFKVHMRKFGLAGARDIVWRRLGDDHRLTLCSEITKNALSEERVKSTSLFDANETNKLQYIGGDAQYFTVVLMPDEVREKGPDHTFSTAIAQAVGAPDKKRKKRTNTTFRLTSRDITLRANGKPFSEKFVIYAGPKKTEVLEEYGLEECIVYGWFGTVAKPLGQILHFFHTIIGSWGLSIIMLTVLVRGLLYPFGRKMAMNAQKMQELKPEMDKIATKYKDDLEKKAQAQRELFAKHNYNPFAGCLVMFFQFPIFIGLYRTLSVDIALRQAPFFPGMAWCSNLAGPDQLWDWTGVIPDFLSSTNGWLGPYLNILPLIAAGLMFVQQKLFTPPPSDEQQEIQQKVMKFMMIFMGLLFFKFAAGLCVYFIVSSLWGVAERKLLPKSKPAAPAMTGGSAVAKPTEKPRFDLQAMAEKLGHKNGNGQSTSPAELRKKRKKKRKKK